jgi:SynChlorMet cassette protein ScmD
LELGIKVKYFTIPRNKNFRLMPVEDIIMSDKFKSNPNIVLREEYDDWAVLFDPDTGKTCGLSPTGVFIWKQLDGNNSKADILQELGKVCEDGLPEVAAADYDKFIEQLLESGLVAI